MAVGSKEETEEDKGGGEKRDGEDNAEESKEVAANHQANENKEGVEIEMRAEKFWGQVVAFD